MSALSRYGQFEEQRERQSRCEHEWGEWRGDLSNFLYIRQCEKCWATDCKEKLPRKERIG